MKTQMQFYDGLDVPDVKPETEGITGIGEILEKLVKAFPMTREIELDSYIKTIDDILTPLQINGLLSATEMYTRNGGSITHNRGHFISKLIQNSYEAGHNDFFFNTVNSTNVHKLGIRLKGSKETPIRINIEGDVGIYCGGYSDFVDIKINGNAGHYLGSSTIYSNFEAKNVENLCGYCSNRSTIVVHGEFGEDIRGPYASTINCNFITYNEEMYKRLVKELPDRNLVILRNESGDVCEERT